MAKRLLSKLRILQSDFQEAAGSPFASYYCPILYRDEDVPLCEGHIINSAFPGSARRWTVQRRDVDSFFGSNFESGFVDVVLYREQCSPTKALTNQSLSRRYKPKITVDGTCVPHYRPADTLPRGHTPIEITDGTSSVRLGLKIHPDDMLSATTHKWQVEVSLDMRVSALVSLIKAAHLTLFEMLGYRYALSAGGEFVGKQILGNFFLQNHSKPKSAVLKAALPYFRDFAAMVRPIMVTDWDIKGTTSDRLLFLCAGLRSRPWAMVVLLKTARSLHAVLMPVFEEPALIDRYLRFLENDEDTIEVRLCKYENGAWNVSPDCGKQNWPKTGILYP